MQHSRAWRRGSPWLVQTKLCCDRVASVGLFQELCPMGAVPNYAKIVKVAIPQLNEKGCIIKVRDHSSESKTEVCWRGFAFCVSSIAGRREDMVILENRTVNLELLCFSASGSYHLKHLIRTNACSATSCTGSSQHLCPDVLMLPTRHRSSFETKALARLGIIMGTWPLFQWAKSGCCH